MNGSEKASAITRAGVVVMGVAAIVAGIYMLRPLIMQISLLHSPGSMDKGALIFLFTCLLGPAILISTGIVFLQKADHIAAKYFSVYCSDIERTIYRIAFFVIGLFLFISAITHGLQLIVNLSCIYLKSGFPLEGRTGSMIWPHLVRSLIDLIFGIYLVLGAPSLFGWHLKRCAKIDEK